MKSLAAGIAICLALALGQAVERPMSFDSRGRVYRLDTGTNVASGAFADLSGFDHLELWQTPRGCELEVYRKDGTRERTDITSDQLVRIRQQLDAYLAGSAGHKLNQEGRGSFLLQQLPLALGWYGPAVLLMTEPQSAQLGVALYLLTSSAGFFVPMYTLQNNEMTNSQAHLSVAYGYRGALSGLALSQILDLHDQRGWAGMMLATSIGGQFAGYALARDLSLGQATMVTTYTDFGIVDGLGAGAIIRVLSGVESEGRIVYAGGLAGEVAGTYWGKMRVRNWDCTEGQVVVDRTGGILGMGAPIALYYAFSNFSASGDVNIVSVSLLGIVGNMAGVYLAERQVRDLPLATGNGYIVAGMTAGAAMLGGGLGILLTDEPRVMAATAAAGGVVGFYGGVALARSLPVSKIGHARLGQPRVEVNYASLTGAALTFASNRTISAPNLLTVRF
jgi:hypothetical protein